MRVAALSVVPRCLIASFCAAASVSVVAAQVAAGEVTGTVKDQGGAAAPGARVTVTNVETRQQRVVTSSGDGVYTAASLPPGAYRVDVELSGFKPMRRAGIKLSTGQKARIDLELATNFNAFAGFGVQRPNLAGDPILSPDQRTPSQWFNTAAFVVAPQFTIGSASRNPVRGPSYRDVSPSMRSRCVRRPSIC
jgi:carboxypeptidase family protein